MNRELYTPESQPGNPNYLSQMLRKLGAVCCAVALTVPSLSACKGTGDEKPPTFSTYQVQDGDTLGGIVAKKCNVRYPEIAEGVQQLIIANNLASTTINSGTGLEFPDNLCANLKFGK